MEPGMANDGGCAATAAQKRVSRQGRVWIFLIAPKLHRVIKPSHVHTVAVSFDAGNHRLQQRGSTGVAVGTNLQPMERRSSSLVSPGQDLIQRLVEMRLLALRNPKI